MHPGIVSLAHEVQSSSTTHSETMGSQEQNIAGRAAVTDRVKAIAFRALFLASTPVPAGGALWILEQLILWLQVCRVHRRSCCVCRASYCTPLAAHSTQFLSLPISPGPSLTWAPTLLNSVATARCYASGRAFGSEVVELVGFILATGAWATVVVFAAYVGVNGDAPAFLPPWVTMVRFSFILAYFGVRVTSVTVTGGPACLQTAERSSRIKPPWLLRPLAGVPQPVSDDPWRAVYSYSCQHASPAFLLRDVACDRLGVLRAAAPRGACCCSCCRGCRARHRSHACVHLPACFLQGRLMARCFPRCRRRCGVLRGPRSDVRLIRRPGSRTSGCCHAVAALCTYVCVHSGWQSNGGCRLCPVPGCRSTAVPALHHAAVHPLPCEPVHVCGSVCACMGDTVRGSDGGPWPARGMGRAAGAQTVLLILEKSSRAFMPVVGDAVCFYTAAVAVAVAGQRGGVCLSAWRAQRGVCGLHHCDVGVPTLRRGQCGRQVIPKPPASRACRAAFPAPHRPRQRVLPTEAACGEVHSHQPGTLRKVFVVQHAFFMAA